MQERGDILLQEEKNDKSPLVLLCLLQVYININQLIGSPIICDIDAKENDNVLRNCKVQFLISVMCVRADVSGHQAAVVIDGIRLMPNVSLSVCDIGSNENDSVQSYCKEKFLRRLMYVRVDVNSHQTAIVIEMTRLTSTASHSICDIDVS